MPELPEVETVVRQLRSPLEGKNIKSVRIYDKQRLSFSTKGISGSSIKEIKRVGKEICFDLSSELTLAIHLRMTGRIIVGEELLPKNTYNPQSALSKKHLRVKFKLDRGEFDFFDPRRFGTVKVFKTGEGPILAGCEPLSREFNTERLFQISRKLKQPLKSFLLRQDKIVGLGNIYVAEILFASKLSPFLPCGEMSRDDCSAVVKNTKAILRKAIKNCGTTFSDFQQTTGELGSYQNFLKVYNREGEACRSCKSEIIRETQAGRSSFFCPQCQKC